MTTTTANRAPRPGLRAGGAVTGALLVALVLAALPARAETPAYAFGVVTKTNPPASMRPGQPYPITVVLRNDGTETWFSEEAADGAHPVRLGTVEPDDRQSAFAVQDAAWLWSKGRRVRMLTAVVPPGRNGVFAFTFTAPVLPGVYPEERFRPLAEGRAWMTGSTIVFPPVTVPNPGAAPSVPAAGLPPEPCLPSMPRHEGARAPAVQDAGPPAAALGYGAGSARGPALTGPTAVALAPNGDVFVADAANHRIVKMRPDGTVLKTFGSGQMLAPSGIAV
ncbi:MAG TPA: hypothetical protein VM841_00055, partial [Actinomycetota bacterium]|nr:hypothetical protein [Actinomycetota bacterium]